MNKMAVRYSLSAGITLLAYAALWKVWMGWHQLAFSLLLALLALGLIAAVNSFGREAAAPPVVEPAAPALPAPSTGLFALARAAGGALLIYGAYQSVHGHAWSRAGLYILGAALAWRSGVTGSLPLPSERFVKRALIGLLLAASLFRFYRAGDIPIGLATIDEPRIKMQAQSILDGGRQSFSEGPGIADGAIPFYLQALSMKLFSVSVKGFRMVGIILGVLLTLVIFHLASSMAGPWAGLATAAFWAVALWPVTVSRSHYLMIESYAVYLGLLFLFYRAKDRDSAWLFALTGLLWGCCFNIYKSGQLSLVLFPLLYGMTWLYEPRRRQALLQGIPPVLAGFALGLAPLLMWAWQDPRSAYSAYFGSLHAAHTAGDVVDGGFFTKMDFVLGRVIPQFEVLSDMFTKRGPSHAYFFMTDVPVISPATLYLFLAGMAVCLIRFRNAAIAYLLYWWFAGLFPALVANPATTLNDRRAMLAMPPMLIIASLGLLALAETHLRALTKELRAAWLGLAGALFFAFFGHAAWVQYFDITNTDKDFLIYNRANLTSLCRAVQEETAKRPAYVVSTFRMNSGLWTGPNPEPTITEYWAINPHQPTFFTQQDAPYYANGGLFYALAQRPAPEKGQKAQDILVVLTAFHFYLEPFLVKELGGELVRDVPRVSSRQGPVDMPGMADHPTLAAKLVRLREFDLAKLEPLRKDRMLPYVLEAITPPPSVGAHEVIQRGFIYEPDMLKAFEAYERAPGAWKVTKTGGFAIPDAYYWTVTGNMPGDFGPPMRIKADWQLDIPQDGLYSFGASTTMHMTIKIDGREVFRFSPRSGADHDRERAGILGAPVMLKAGKHRFQAEQVMLSSNGNYNQLVRMMWKAPGGEPESLPLAHLRPVASR